MGRHLQQSSDKPLYLRRCLRYRYEIVRNHIAPFVRNHAPGIMLQQDNARPHVARVVQNELQARNIEILPWPANSPDLSPIEHVWDELKRRLQHRQHPPLTVHDLRQAVVQEWQNIPQEFLRRCIRSMRRRCQAVINARGGHTRY
jgi:transposase